MKVFVVFNSLGKVRSGLTKIVHIYSIFIIARKYRAGFFETSVESNVFTLVLLSDWSKKVRETLSTTSDGYEPKPIVTCSRAFSRALH